MSEQPEVGSLAEETVKLLGALGSVFGEQAGDPAAAQPDQSDSAAEDQLSGECRWCPVCRLAHAVRETHPDVHRHLAAAAQSLIAAGLAIGKAVAEAAPEPGTDPAEQVQHIDVGQDWPEEEE